MTSPLIFASALAVGFMVVAALCCIWWMDADVTDEEIVLRAREILR